MSISFKNVRHYILCNLGECYGRKAKKRVAIKEMRKHISYYIKNLPNATIIRNEINKIDKQDELVACLTEYFNKL